MAVDPASELEAADLDGPGEVGEVRGTGGLGVDCDSVDNVAGVVEEPNLSEHELFLYTVMKDNLRGPNCGERQRNALHSVPLERVPDVP